MRLSRSWGRLGMRCEWETKSLGNIIDFNPTERLAKGTISKKIAMEKLQPYNKSISSYELSKYNGGTKFRNGDTIMARITPCLENGKTAQVNILDANEIGFGSTEFIVMRAKPNISDKNYIYYLSISPLVREIAIKSMVGSSGRQRVQQDVLSNTEILVPPLETQQKIASILSALDDKIELNNAINKNLEEQAGAIYQQYLIDNNDNLVRMKLGDICDVKGGKRLPKGINLISTPNNHPYIRVRDLNNTSVLTLNESFEYVDDETQKGISRYIVSTSDILISIVGTIGLSALVHQSLDNANLTENCVKLTNFDEVTQEFVFMFLRSEIGRREINKRIVGAVQQKLPIKNIQSIELNLLPKSEMTTLGIKLKTIFNKVSNNIEINNNISTLRDTLLPKLMSGELDVSEIDF